MLCVPRTEADRRMSSSVASLVLLHLLQTVSSSPVSTLPPSPPTSLSSSSPSPISLDGASSDLCPLELRPSRLVVRYGDSVSASCYLTKGFGLLGWEPQGSAHPEALIKGEQFGTLPSTDWYVDNLTVWNMMPMCYKVSDESESCHLEMDITVFKPPDSVSLSYKDHAGPLLEGNMYSLQCDVQNVAPVKKLRVTFYRGDTAISSPQVITDQEKTPVDKTFTHNITASKEDNHVLYWCEAQLDLGPEGPLPPPVVRSQNISATIYYKPHKEQTQYHITITEGDHINLTCQAEGNPSPYYTWMIHEHSPAVQFHEDVLSISSITFDHAGQYTCVATNSQGNITVTYDVVVKFDILPLVAGLVAAVVVVAVAIACFVYSSYHRHTRRGHYKLKDVIHFRNSNHVAQPNGT